MSFEETAEGYVDCPCPYCCEDRADFLVWQDDDTVRCSSCGLTYRPAGHGDGRAYI